MKLNVQAKFTLSTIDVEVTGQRQIGFLKDNAQIECRTRSSLASLAVTDHNAKRLSCRLHLKLATMTSSFSSHVELGPVNLPSKTGRLSWIEYQGAFDETQT